jgi:putative membrane protein
MSAVMRWTDADRELLRDAVRVVETKSRAEVVLAVRPRSDSYDRGPLLFGALVAWAVLGFELFSSYEFPLDAIFLEPLLLGVAAAFLAASLPAVTRILASPRKRRQSVERAARATFQERGVGLTRERTGVLLYVSLLERDAVVVADKGITDTVPPEVWTPAVSRVVALARSARGAPGLAQAIQLLAEPLAAELPARADDADELPDFDEAVQ